MDNSPNTLKQGTPFGCFINCYAMVKSYYVDGFEFNKDDELDLLEKSFRFDRGCYEPHLINELMQDHSVEVFIESDYLVWKYQKLSENLGNKIDPEHKIMLSGDYREAVKTGLGIVLLDKWSLDMYTHFAHWVVISGYSDSYFTVNDSWTGREIQMPKTRFMDSIKSLRNNLNCSPVLVSVEK